MPTQYLKASVTGEGHLQKASIITPALLMSSIDGSSRVNALLGGSPLPGATMAGISDVTIEKIGLGHVLTLTGGLAFGGSLLTGSTHVLEIEGGLEFGGSAYLMIIDPAVPEMEGGLAFGGELKLSVAIALTGLGS